MGTRADFYVGAGPDAEWLGSIAYDGYRIDEMEARHATKDADCAACWAIKNAKSEQDFREAVADLLGQNDDATMPDQGWPWPWETSDTTDYAYCFDGGRVRTFCFGSELLGEHRKNSEEERKTGPGIEFPNMKDRMNTTYGKRSGLLILGG